MSLAERLSNIPTLELALVLIQPDDNEFLPGGYLQDGESIDLAIFDPKRLERFRQAIQGNPSLMTGWKTRVLPLVDYFASQTGDTKSLSLADIQSAYKQNPQSVFGVTYYLQLGALLLQSFEGPADTRFSSNPVSWVPPGLKTTSSLGVTLFMFQENRNEALPDSDLGPREFLDISFLTQDNPPRKKFEVMIAENAGLKKQWDEKVLLLADGIRSKDRDGSPNQVSLSELEGLFRNPNDRRDVISHLRAGVEILDHVASDDRSWIAKESLSFTGAKKVLGGGGPNDLSQIPSQWFERLAQGTTIREALGERWYHYLLGGGYLRNGHVSYRELAQISKVDGHKKGIFTRLFFGLDEKSRMKVLEAWKEIQANASFLTFSYLDFQVELYMDVAAPFVEVHVQRSGEEQTVIEIIADGTDNVEQCVVQNPTNISIALMERILFSIKRWLKDQADFQRQRDVLERMLVL